VSIRALIELKWPLAKEAMVKKMFIPYVIFLLLYLVYSVYIFEIYTVDTDLVEANQKCWANQIIA
jgi:hypothetical protein